MNLGQNKFFIALGATVLIGGLALGYLVYQSSSDFDDATTRYNEQVQELNRLQRLDLYPEEANLKMLEEQKKIAHETAISLHQQLMPMAFPLEPMTPEQFQDKLNASAKALADKAAAAGVNLPDKLYLGFAEYRTVTPIPEAAAALGRQLKCIEMVIDAMIEKKVASIEKISRTPLPEEIAAAKADVQGQKAKGPKGGKPGNPVPELISKFPFEVQFIAEQKSFQAVLNEVSKDARQFFIIRPLVIKNQNEKAPKKVDPADKANDPAAAAPDKNGAASKQLRYVLGAEKLNVTLRFDAVVFSGNLPK